MCTTHTYTHTHTQGDTPVLILYSFNFEVDSTSITTSSILPTLYIELGCRQGREMSVYIVTELQAGRPICSDGNGMSSPKRRTGTGTYIRCYSIGRGELLRWR